MPTVGTYGDPKINPTALPGARQQAHETFESLGGRVGEAQAAFGATVARVGIEVVSAAYKKAREHFDQITNLTTLRQFNDLDLQGYAPDGLMNAQGLDAMAGLPEALAKWDQQAGMIQANLKTDAQRLFFEGQRVARRAAVERQWTEHGMVELRRHDDAEFKALHDSSIQRAIANPENEEIVGQSLSDLTGSITEYADRNGIGPEVKATMLAEAHSAVHVGIINRLLAAGQDRRAAIHYEEATNEILGDQRAAVERALQEGSTRTASQQAADAILAAGGTDAEQLAKVRAITDPKLRDATRERVEHELAVTERLTRDAHEALTTKAGNTIDRTNDWRRIPSAEWSTFTVGEKAAFKAYTEKRVKAEPIETDPNLYYELSIMATSTDQAERTQFLQTNLAEYIDQLSITDRKHFMDLQGAQRSGDAAKAAALLTTTGVGAKMEDEALVGMGFDPTPAVPGTAGYNKDNAAAVGRFRRAVREAVTRLEARPDRQGKPATDAERQSIVDQLRTPTPTITPGRFFGTTTTPGFAFQTAQAQAVSVADVPASERRQIEAALRAKGRPITDAAILALFNLNLSNTRKDR